MEVAFVANSNWALDASKNNRGLMVSILKPNANELLETALKIEKDYCNTETKSEFKKKF